MRKIDAFISYSRRQNETIVQELQSSLQSFSKKWWKKRAAWVFRDETSLSATPALWPSIVSALEDSESLIVLASPDAARSKWVNKEIDWWLANKSSDRLFLVLLSGSLDWDSQIGDFADSASACPPKLRRVFQTEPRYVDLRVFTSRHRKVLHKDPAFRSCVADIASAIHQKPKEELFSEELNQEKILKRVAVSVASVMAILLAASIWLANLAAVNATRAENALENVTSAVSGVSRTIANRFIDHKELPIAIVDDVLLEIEQLITSVEESAGENPELLQEAAFALTQLAFTRLQRGGVDEADRLLQRAQNILAVLKQKDGFAINPKLGASLRLGRSAINATLGEPFEHDLSPEEASLLPLSPSKKTHKFGDVHNLSLQLDAAFSSGDPRALTELAPQLATLVKDEKPNLLSPSHANIIAGAKTLLAKVHCSIGDASHGIQYSIDAKEFLPPLELFASNSRQVTNLIYVIHNTHGTCAARLGKADDALNSLRKAYQHAKNIKENDNNFIAISNFGASASTYGRVLLQSNSIKDAIQVLEEGLLHYLAALDLDAGNMITLHGYATLSLNLALGYGLIEKNEELREVAEAALAKTEGVTMPQIEMARANLFRLLTWGKNAAENAQKARKIWSRYVSNPIFSAEAGQALRETHHFFDYLIFLEEADSSFFSKDYLESEKSALKAARAATEADKQNNTVPGQYERRALWTLAAAQWYLGKPAVALSNFEHALELYGGINPNLVLLVAHTKLATGDKHGALELYRTAVTETVDLWDNGEMIGSYLWDEAVVADLKRYQNKGLLKKSAVQSVLDALGN